MIDGLGGRKFFGFILVAILLTVLVLANKVQADQFIAFLTANFGFYVAGNAVEHITDDKGNGIG